MYKNTLAAVIMTAISLAANAAETVATPPKAGLCRSPNLLSSRAKPDEITIYCENMGMVRSINAIYEKGFRIVSSGLVPEELRIGLGEIYFIIEERK